MQEVVETKKRRHRKSSHIDPLEEKKKKLTESHPLSVQLTLSLADRPTLRIKFNYRPNLRIVTVTSTVDVPSKITGFILKSFELFHFVFCHLSGNAAKEVLTGESILNELIKDDLGTSSPNPSNQFQLQKVGLGSYHNLVTKFGYAYIWAQKICGLEFLTEETKRCENKISQANIENVVRTIYTRLKHRFALSEQLQYLGKLLIFLSGGIKPNCFLEQLTFPSLPKSVECPYNVISSITKWSPSNHQAFCQNSSIEYFIENEVVGVSDLYYFVTITRQKGNLS